MRGQHVLHLEWMDVLAARDDHVVDAPVEPQVAVVVEVTRVAGAVPAVPHRLRIGVGPIPVGRERLVRPEMHEDLAAVVDPEPRVDCRAAGAPRLGDLVASDREGVDLGRAVVVDEDLRPEDVDAAPHEGRRHRRAGVAESAHRGDVRHGRVRVVDEVVEERRREVQGRDPLLGDEPERLARIPARLRDEAAPDEVHREQRVDPHRVVERHHAERPVAPGVAVLERLRPRARAVGARASEGRPSVGPSSRRCRGAARSPARRDRARRGARGLRAAGRPRG